jgi:hypothetical protein
MLFAKGLSIIFSLLSGMEQAKAALYHFVFGGGQDRPFPYTEEIKVEILPKLQNVLQVCFAYKIDNGVELDAILNGQSTDWKDDLYFTVGGFLVYPSLHEEGIILQLEDKYDWHSNNAWFIPKTILDKLPNLFKKVIFNNLKPTLTASGSWMLEEGLFSAFGIPYFHRGEIFLSWEELGTDLSYAIPHLQSGRGWMYRQGCFYIGEDVEVYPDYWIAGPHCNMALPVPQVIPEVKLPHITRDSNLIEDFWSFIGFEYAEKWYPPTDVEEEDEEDEEEYYYYE